MKGAILMKKSDLWTGVLFTAVSVACLIGGLVEEPMLGSCLCGLAGALGVPGVMMLMKYYKWTRPQNVAAYQARLEQEQIDLQDERKEMLLNKSGRYAYIFNLVITCVVLFMLSLFSALEIITVENWLVLGLAGWLLVQYFTGVLFYWMLSRKY